MNQDCKHLKPIWSISENKPLVSIALLSPFSSAGIIHGGGFRSRQIKAILVRSGLNLIDVGKVSRLNFRLRVRYLAQMFCLRRLKFSLKNIFFKKNRQLWVNAVRTIENCVQQGAKAIIVEVGHSLNPYLLIEALNSRLPVVAIPHNLEALVPEQADPISGKSGFIAIKHEVALLKRCAYVFTISEEEAWFLRNVGCQADCLPYYPDSTDFDMLKLQRKSREQGYGSKILVLGSANNPPTRLGMEKIGRRIASHSHPSNNYFVLAGKGTENLWKYSGLKNVEQLGFVAEDKMTAVLNECRVALVCQKNGSGVLTRICNMLISGIPIVASKHAARSFIRMSGVYTYEESENLDELLEVQYPIPSIPDAPIKEYNNFCGILSEIVGIKRTGG